METVQTTSGKVLEQHDYIPTGEQLDAMDQFVDAMDLMEVEESGFVFLFFDSR